MTEVPFYGQHDPDSINLTVKQFSGVFFSMFGHLAFNHHTSHQRKITAMQCFEFK